MDIPTGVGSKGKPLIWDTIQGTWKKATGGAKAQWRDRLARGKHASPERQQTDEGLRNERQKTDQVLAQRQQAVEKHADTVVDRARGNADAVLATARENADAVLLAARDKAARERDDGVSDVEARGTIAGERLLQDETLRAERSAADERLRREREEDARALRRLLPLERESTDRYLLTERVRSDDAVSNRDDFLGIVTHDLRDLLGGIVMSAAVLSKRAPDNGEGLQTLAETTRIKRYAARMHRLIGDLADVASIDAGSLALTPLPGDARPLLGEAAETFQATALAKGISLEAKIPEHRLLARFDNDRMLQVLSNLLSNSLKFTPEGGRIAVRGELVEEDIRFSVSDTGSGIPETALESIFERFWQVGKNDRRGLGLGLYISRCIVEAHGGRIWAESKRGEGSTVFFTLPRAE
jgi:signal transduction histidine kinase